jgi:peptidyl-prolyl cis-trans isomerase C
LCFLLFCIMLNKKITTFIFISISLLFLVLNCSKKSNSERAATVNGEPVSVAELEYSLNFFPQYAPSKKGQDAVLAHLDLLIEKKLFAQKGKSLGFDKSEMVTKVTNWVQREEMLKELYAREIRDKVVITEKEIQQRFILGLESVHVRHLFFTTEEQAIVAKNQLNAGASFHKIALQTFKDSILQKNGGDLGFLTFDQMDLRFAEAAFALNNGEVSAPVQTQWGFHIIRVEDRRKMVFADKATLESKRTSVERDLRLEQEKLRGQEFVGNFMRQFDVKMINSTFNTLGAELFKVVLSATENVPQYQPILGGKELELMSNGLQSYFDLPLISFTGGEWTIKDFIDIVRVLPITKRPRMENPVNFRHDIGLLVRDEFLNLEAQKRGYDKLDHVEKEVKKWRDDFTFSEYWRTVKDTIEVSDKNVESFFQKHQGRYVMPERVRVQEILVATRDEAQNIIDKINAGKVFTDLARKHSLRSWAAEKGGDLGWLKSGDYGNTSTKAFDLENGQVGGPYKVREGYVVIRKIDSHPARPMIMDEARDWVIKEAVSNIQNQYYKKLKAELYEKSTIEKNMTIIEKLGKDFHNSQKVQMPALQEVAAP